MEIKEVGQILGDLSIVELNCLVPDRQTYGAMLLQPDGPIVANNRRIGHLDQNRGAELCRKFLQESIINFASLVITPEYCLPWTLVKEIAEVNSDLIPPKGAIWALGCESITWTELLQIRGAISSENTFIFFEEIPGQILSVGTYLDPLLYVFWSTRLDGTHVLCFVIQFKTAPCSDYEDIEQRSLCCGKYVYIFNKGTNNINLMTIICSDIFKFTHQVIDSVYKDLLLVHIQINPKPAHEDYAEYRKYLQRIATSAHVEVLCLNWASNIIERKDNNTYVSWKNNAGSAIYVPPSKFYALENLVLDAHRNGLYYSIVGRWHAFYLNQQPHAIFLQKQKVMTHAELEVGSTISFATVLRRWTWNKVITTLNLETAANDGFHESISHYTKITDQLRTLSEQSPIFVERALEMLVGAPKKPHSWFEISVLDCMRVGEREALRRVTVNQDNDPISAGLEYRRKRLEFAQTAVALVGQGIDWPYTLRDLEDGFIFTWTPNKPHHNIQALETKQSAGLVFLSEQALDDGIKTIYTILHSSAKRHAEDAHCSEDEVIRSTDRLCVIYRRDNKLHAYPKLANQINHPPASSLLDFTGEAM